ncbi:MAG: zinc-dependent dehydrogenase [Candidatus Nitrosocaldus sp.]|nr:zinc-dependent dehydrogenase [Candidatus Nitrosocaldus sp.]
MKAVLLDGDGVSIRDVPRPEVGEGDILVRMHACGLCGSDIEKVYGRYGVVSRRLGHEPAGEVVAVGSKVKGIRVGDRVFVHHHVPCYSCYYCNHGDYTMCEHYQRSNIEPCGLAELFLVPEWNVTRGGVIVLPEHVTFEEAAMIEPLACCIKALDASSMRDGDSVAVLGVGPAGMMHVMLARSRGAGKVIALDVNDFRLDFASKMGADICINVSKDDPIPIARDATEQRGVDIAMVATGNVSAVQTALRMVRRGGKVVLFGVPSKGTSMQLDLNHLFSNEIKIVPSLAASDHDTMKAFRMIAGREVDVARIITHRFRLDDALEAIECAHRASDAMKVIVTG